MATNPRLDSFRSDPFQMGIDLKRSIIITNPGVYVAEPGAAFRMGMLLRQNPEGRLVLLDGTAPAPANVPFGFAKANKTDALVGSLVDEPVVLTGVVASNVKKAPIFGGVAGYVLVRSAPVSGVVYVEGVDYTVNYVNGQIVRTGGSAIPSGATVYVSYAYQLLANDLDFQGRNFFNFTDDVSIQDGHVTVIQAWSQLFVTTYDPSLQFAINDAVYGDGGTKAGLLTTAAGGGRPLIGRVMQVPTAADPFLGIRGSILAA